MGISREGISRETTVDLFNVVSFFLK